MSHAKTNYASHINENAFILCKPHADTHHAEIMELLFQAGIQVQARSFIMRHDTAEIICRGYPSVQHALAGSGQRPGARWVREEPANTAAPALTDAKELLAAHVAQLCGSGTCLAAIVSAPNAVERLVEMAGPENPVDACRTAPQSLRARFGIDLVRNAVHVATTLAEASICIRATFGYEPQYSTADTHTAAAEDKAAAAVSRPRVSVRPNLSAVALPSSATKTVGDMILASIVAAEGAQPLLHRTYYTGSAQALSSTTALLGADGGAARVPASPTYTPEELAKERQQLAQWSEVLRARELDIVLREQQLEERLQRTAQERLPTVAQEPRQHSRDASGQGLAFNRSALSTSTERHSHDRSAFSTSMGPRRRSSKWTFQVD